MRAQDRVLLVEGESDRSFFEVVLDHIGLRASVLVAPPRIVGGQHNSKEGLLRHLPVLLKQLTDGTWKRLGVVLDADFVANSALGFARTSERIEAVFGDAGYERCRRTPQQHGLVFRHPDGLPDLGAWIMPNNRDDGALENFLHPCVAVAETDLFRHARATVETLPLRKFGDTQQAKADLSTWLAWQQHPGRGLHHALRDGLFDAAHPAYVGLTAWLGEVFR